jgi:hypothetical protein
MHEAGHAVAAWAIGFSVMEVAIVEDRGYTKVCKTASTQDILDAKDAVVAFAGIHGELIDQSIDLSGIRLKDFGAFDDYQIVKKALTRNGTLHSDAHSFSSELSRIVLSRQGRRQQLDDVSVKLFEFGCLSASEIDAYKIAIEPLNTSEQQILCCIVDCLSSSS